MQMRIRMRTADARKGGRTLGVPVHTHVPSDLATWCMWCIPPQDFSIIILISRHVALHSSCDAHPQRQHCQQALERFVIIPGIVVMAITRSPG